MSDPLTFAERLRHPNYVSYFPTVRLSVHFFISDLPPTVSVLCRTRFRTSSLTLRREILGPAYTSVLILNVSRTLIRPCPVQGHLTHSTQFVRHNVSHYINLGPRRGKLETLEPFQGRRNRRSLEINKTELIIEGRL